MKLNEKMIKEAAKVMYSDGNFCTREEIESLIKVVEAIIVPQKIDAEIDYYDYDFETVVEYLKTAIERNLE